MPLSSPGDVVHNDGWTPVDEQWAYASADSPTFTFTVPADVTAKYSPGMRIRLTQTTVKYFIITAVSTFSGGVTTITVYGGTDYTLANAVISSPGYSVAKAPVGFPLDPTKWTVTASDVTGRTQSSPTQNTWYNLGSLSISIPIGCWSVSYSVESLVSVGSQGNIDVVTTLSTANSTESDADFTVASQGQNLLFITLGRVATKVLTVAAKTSYFLNTRTTTAVGAGTIQNNNDKQKAIIRAVCAYL